MCYDLIDNKLYKYDPQFPYNLEYFFVLDLRTFEIF